MKLTHLNLDQLKPAQVNVRKKGAKEIHDLVPSIRALGLLQPLLVRPNCKGFEIVAGQRRYHALVKLREDGRPQPVPCIVMDEGDDVKAIEASLAENVARLPMDEIDQHKAFSALQKKGRSVEDIAAHFGIHERVVKQRLAIGNLIAPILNAFRKDALNATTLRTLTMATKKQQRLRWDMYKDESQHAPEGSALRSWLFGGEHISAEAALFDEAEYKGAVVSDLFGKKRYFDDATSFWTLQSKAIAQAKGCYEQNGWEVVVLDTGTFWSRWEHAEASKANGGRVYVEVRRNGEVTFHEGFITEKEAKRRARAKAKEDGTLPATDRPELTKPMQSYLALHRHAAVRAQLLGHQDVALRLMLAQVVAGSDLVRTYADPQKTGNEATAQSLASSKAQSAFANERSAVRKLLGIGQAEDATLIYRKDDWGNRHDVHAVFSRLLELGGKDVSRILTFVAAETLPCGHALSEVLGDRLEVDMADCWTPDQAFFDLLRDKEAINAMVKEAAGKSAAEANTAATAKVQRKVIQDCLNGSRKGGKTDWMPRYMSFPMRAYTKRGGIDAIDAYRSVRKLFAA